MGMILDHRRTLFLRLSEIVQGMMPWLDAGLCPPPSHGVLPIREILPEVREECLEIHAEQDEENNITGEASP